MTVGETIRMWRQRKGWSQTNLAAAADLSISTVQNLESGRHSTHASNLRAVAEALGRSFEELDTVRRGDAESTLAMRIHEVAESTGLGHDLVLRQVLQVLDALCESHPPASAKERKHQVPQKSHAAPNQA